MADARTTIGRVQVALTALVVILAVVLAGAVALGVRIGPTVRRPEAAAFQPIRQPRPEGTLIKSAHGANLQRGAAITMPIGLLTASTADPVVSFSCTGGGAVAVHLSDSSSAGITCPAGRASTGSVGLLETHAARLRWSLTATGPVRWAVSIGAGSTTTH